MRSQPGRPNSGLLEWVQWHPAKEASATERMIARVSWASRRWKVSAHETSCTAYQDLRGAPERERFGGAHELGVVGIGGDGLGHDKDDIGAVHCFSRRRCARLWMGCRSR